MKNKINIFLWLIAVLCFILFFTGGPGYDSSRSFKHFWDTGHILFFSIFSWFFSFYLGRNFSFPKLGCWILFITLMAGGGVELIQSTGSRSPSMSDLYRDFLGSFLTLSFFIPQRKRLNKYTLKAFQTAVIIIIVLSFVPLKNALVDEWNARKAFPLLADFERSGELKRWNGNANRSLNSEIIFSGSHSMEIGLKTTTYSGVSLKYFPHDWSGYQFIEFRVYNPSESELKMTCRIHDRRHTEGKQRYEDRFNRTFKISGGWNHIRIPLADVEAAPKERKMDMKQIAGMGIFAVRLPEPRKIYLDDVRLGKE